MTETGQELSRTKSLCTASSGQLGSELCSKWKKAGIDIQYKQRVRALGVGLGAGRRRNMSILKLRRWNYRSRISRFRRLKAVGVNTARLVRTGIRALTYGSSITDVPNGLMHGQRQTVAAMTAPGAGTWGAEP